MGETERRRRRVRPSHGRPGPETSETPAEYAPAEGAAAETEGIADPVETAKPGAVEAAPAGPSPAKLAERGGPPPRPEQPRDRVPGRPEQPRDRPARADQPRGRGPGEEGERGLRGLVGSGSSQVSVTAAMRARDAARPTDEQVADAEANLPIVRRNWTPREELPRNR